MDLNNKNTIKLSELIHWVKQELLSDEARRNDPVPLFVIDEITVEVNFVLAGEGQSGFEAVIVKADAQVAEERVQKATVRLKPLISVEELATEFANQHPLTRRQVLSDFVRVLIRGRGIRNDEEETVIGRRE